MKFIGNLKIKKSSEIKESRIGIGFECLDRDLFKPQKCYDAFSESGAKFARLISGWAKTEKVKGVYDFTWLDEVVDNLIARGISPWLNVSYGNPVYMPDCNNPTAVGYVPTLYSEEVQQAWKNYVTALAKRFKGRVTHFEIWNEPDMDDFWQPHKPNGEEYGKFVKLTGGLIRKVIPDAKIGACSAISKSDFVSDILNQLDPDDLDFFCVHQYDSELEFGSKTVYTAANKKLLKNFGFEKAEIWMGEGGYCSWFPKGHFQFPEGGGNEYKQAVWLLRRAFNDFRNGMRLSSFYIIADPWEHAYVTAVRNEKKHPAYGILNGLTYTKKQAHTAVSCLANILGGDTLPELSKLPVTLSVPLTSDKPCPVFVSFTNDSNEVIAYWLPYPIEEERGITGTCAVTFDRNSEVSDPIIIDLLDGRVFAPDASDWDVNTKTLKNLPIGEYPFVLCDKTAFEVI